MCYIDKYGTMLICYKYKNVTRGDCMSDEMISEYIKELQERCSNLQKLLNEKDIEIKKLKNQLNRKGESTGRNRNKNISDTMIIKLKDEGKSVRTIAKETGISPTTVQKILVSNKNINGTS